MRKLLIVNIAKSPGLYQHILGFDEVLKYISEGSCGLFRDQMIRVNSMFDIFYHGRNRDSLFIFAPHYLTPFYAFFARIRGIQVFHWLHEPTPLQFLASNLDNHSKWSILKILFLSLIYNPLSILLATDVVVCSKYAVSSLQCSLLGFFVACLRRPVHLCSLPYPSSLAQYSSRINSKGIAVCGSLNSDKGIDLLFGISERLPSLPINILCTSSALKSNSFLKRLSDFPSVNLYCKDVVSDDDIYSHISENSHIFLGYKAITQSGLLPIALAVGTVPIVSRLPAFALEFWDKPNLVFILPEDACKVPDYLASLSRNPGYGDESISYFLDTQMNVVKFLALALDMTDSSAEMFAIAFRQKIAALFPNFLS